MKKTLVLFILAAILLLSGCVNDTVAQGGVVVRGSSPTVPPQVVVPANEDIVYITPNGTKYHTADCPLFGESFMPITLEQAIQESRQPCSLCH
jgi:hypothetical protein